MIQSKKETGCQRNKVKSNQTKRAITRMQTADGKPVGDTTILLVCMSSETTTWCYVGPLFTLVQREGVHAREHKWRNETEP